MSSKPTPVFEIVATVLAVGASIWALGAAGAGGIAVTLFMLGFVAWLWAD